MNIFLAKHSKNIANFITMATANIILDTRRADKNKCYPIKLRIVHQNKNVSISLNKNIPVDSWVLGKNGLEVDKKYPNAKAINLDLSATLVKANQAISD
ncbi:MAG: Arm DNA-binding domain-containing protein, partial [Odoribacter sp.]